MRNAAAAVLLLLAAAVASATPTVASIEPNVGLVYTHTRVIIRGTEFSESDLRCVDYPGLCPAAVVFVVPVNGTLIELAGSVIEVSPTHIELLVPARPHGTVAEVKVRVQRKGEVVVKDGFRWDSTSTSSNPADYKRYLIPVAGPDRPGAGGSIWTTEWTLYSALNFPFTMIWSRCLPNVSPCPGPVVEPGLSRPPIYPRGDGGEGAFVYVPALVAGGTAMSLRVRDLSKNAANHGTEIPVVTDADYTNQGRGVIRLLDIPTDAKYRVTLRIYGPNESAKEVSVSVVNESGSLAEHHAIFLSGSEEAVPETFPLHPAYAQLDPLTPAIRAAGPRVQIQIYAFHDVLISPPPIYPIWAFVTITNNETQQVTTVTPSR